MDSGNIHTQSSHLFKGNLCVNALNIVIAGNGIAYYGKTNKRMFFKFSKAHTMLSEYLLTCNLCLPHCI